MAPGRVNGGAACHINLLLFWERAMSTSPLPRWISLVACALFCAAQAQAAPFGNGSFELPGGATTTRTIIGSGENLGGWVNGTQGTQVYQAGHTDNIESQDEWFYVSFGHNGTTGGTLSQTFDTEVGATYDVNYHIAPQQGLDPEQKAAAFVYDQANTTSAGFLAGEINDVGTSAFVWTRGKPVRFVARSAQSTLMFQDLTPSGAGGGANWGVDNVTVVKATSGTPTTPTTPVVTAPSFTATVSGQDFLQTVVGNIKVGSADVGEALQVYALVVLRNGLILAKSGTGNNWVLISQNFLDVPVVQSFTGSADTLSVPLYSATNLKGLGATVYIGYGKSLTDMITTQKFGMLHSVE